jgi:hypothetical protein
MSRDESAKQFLEIFCQSRKEQEPLQNGSEHKESQSVRCKQWICLLTIDEVEKHRQVNCIHYDECLNEACSFAWDGFTCITCCDYVARKEGNNETDL